MPHFFEHYVKGKPRYIDLDNRKIKPLLKCIECIIKQAYEVLDSEKAAGIE